jgi:hypothetical protein
LFQEKNEKKEEVTKLRIENESKVIDMNSCYIKHYSDFVLPPNAIFDLRQRFENLKQILEKVTPKHLRKPREKTNRTPYPKYPVFDLTQKPHFDVFDLPKEPNANFQVFNLTKPYKKIFEEKHEDFTEVLADTEDFARSITGTITKNLMDVSKQLYYMAKIEDREKIIDEFLGSVFAEIYELEGGYRCFAIPEISYFFFNMFKTNIIVNQHRFLNKFLSHLPFEQVKEFVLYNFSLFSNKEYINYFEQNLNKKDLPPDEKLKQESEYINQFVINYVSVIDIYKDMTEYHDPSKILSNGTLFMNVMRSIQGDLGRLLLNDMVPELVAASLFLYIHKLVNIIPFINSIPFMDNLLTYLVTKIVMFVFQKLIKIFRSMAGVIKKKFKEIMKDFQKTHYDFDYDKIINNALDETVETPTVTLSFDNLDSIYKNAYKRSGNLFQSSLDNSRLYIPKDSDFNENLMSSDVDYFNRYVMGTLILKRMFKSHFPVYIVKNGQKINLMKVNDYETKLKLFEEVYKVICTNEDWHTRYFEAHNEVLEESLMNDDSEQEFIENQLKKHEIVEVFGEYIII